MQTPFSALLDPDRYPSRLVIAGELDIATAADLRSAVRSAIELEGVKPPLQIDCRALDFIDGSGVGALLAARKWASSREVPVYIVDPSRTCRRILDILDLNHLVAA